MIFYDNIDEMSLFNDAMEAGGMAWWLMEYPSGMVQFNANKVKMLGYTQKDAEKFVHYTAFTDLIHPDDYAQAMKAMTDHISGATKNYVTEYRIKAKDGSYRKFFDRGRIVARNPNNDLAIAGLVVDITGQKIVPESN
jgi:two-component system CheB/CheR fusion protein